MCSDCFLSLRDYSVKWRKTLQFMVCLRSLVNFCIYPSPKVCLHSTNSILCNTSLVQYCTLDPFNCAFYCARVCIFDLNKITTFYNMNGTQYKLSQLNDSTTWAIFINCLSSACDSPQKPPSLPPLKWRTFLWCIFLWLHST